MPSIYNRCSKPFTEGNSDLKSGINLPFPIMTKVFKGLRKGETMSKAIIEALSKFPKEAVKTITCDRGSEFADWRKIEEELNCQMYFADPYCA